ncbi:uncharacterized protein LOC130935824 [Arachis stenosperma]|uniref:uncharacterized protein LOC130935824 n=1 Tax=Arachis stenosperma TaxID=217475 RepID=UPI0025AC9919|nr:uncharacterized protein LOC130935824 [Arachis stenosperma]
MGNCLVVQENVVKIMKTDGKVLEYKAPIKVEQVLVDFSGHVVSDSLLRHLQPNTKLLGGSLYHLVPPPPPPSQQPSTPKSSKKVRFAEPEVQDVQESKVVTIKVVISKQQLRDMMQKGVVSVDKMLSMVHRENQVATDDDDDEEEGNRDFCDNAWKPPLESITEVN